MYVSKDPLAYPLDAISRHGVKSAFVKVSVCARVCIHIGKMKREKYITNHKTQMFKCLERTTGTENSKRNQGTYVSAIQNT